MSDIVNAFKQTKGYKKRKNPFDTQEVAQNTQPEQEETNTALQASQQDNIAYNTSGTKDSDRLAQLEQLAAAETAQNEANRQAAIAAEEARKQAEEAQKRVQEQQEQLSRADASRRNFDDINNGTNSLYNDYVNAYNATKDSYKNLLGDSASGTANYHINNVLNKIKDKDENALSNSQSFMNAYNQLSSDDKWDVYQNLQDAKAKIKQAYAVAEKNNNSDMMNNLSTMYKYADMYEGMVSDVDKGDKSFFKSIGDWFASGGVAGDLAEPLTNALGDITGSDETSRAIRENRATKEEGNNGAVQFLDTGSNLVANTALNVATGGWYGLGTAGANLGHEVLSAFTDADRDYALNEEGNLERRNQTNEQKLSDIGVGAFNLALSAAGMKGTANIGGKTISLGPNIKFSGGETLQNLVKNKNYGEIAKGLLKYAGKELPWAAATTAGETGIRAYGYGNDAWNTYGQDMLNNIIGDLGMDVTGAIREGQTGNRDLFRINQETGKVELDNSIRSKLSDEDNAKVQQRLDDFQEGVKNAVDNEGKVNDETGRVDENGRVEDVSKVDETKLNQDAKAVSDETNARITAEQMARNSENSQRVNQNTEALRDILNESQRQTYNQQVTEIRNELQQNKISYDQYLQKVEQIQNQYLQQAQANQVEQQQESATGQRVNPEDVSNIVEGAENTNASEVTTKQTTPEEGFSEARNEATAKQSEMGEGMARTEGEDPIERAYESARQRYAEALESGDRGAIEAAKERYNQLLSIRANQDVTGLDYQTGLKINDLLAQRMSEEGYDNARVLADQMFDLTEGNRPFAYDYGTKEPLTMYEDIVEALRKYKGVDADGNQYRTGDDIYSERQKLQEQAFRDAIEESIARQEAEEARQQEPQDVDELNDMLARASESDREPIIDQAFDDRVANEYGRQEMAGEEMPGTPTPRQEVETAFRDYENSLRETGMTEELWRKIANARVESGRNSKDGKVNVDLNKVLTPEEQAIAKQYFEVKAGGDTALAKEMYDSAYLTIQEAGTDYVGRAKEELINSGAFDDIYHNTKYVIGGDEADPFLADADYMLRKSNPDLYTKMASYDEAVDIAPNATPEQAKAYAEKAVEVYNQLNQKADNVVKEKTTMSDVRDMRPADGFGEMGKALGVKKTQDNTKLTALQKAGVNFGKGSSDFQIAQATKNYSEGLKLQLWANSEAYARTLNNEQVANMIRSEVPLSKAQEQSVFNKQEMNRIYDRTLEFTGSQKAAEMAVNRLMLNKAIEYHTKNTLTKTEYTDPSMKKWVNHIASEVLVGRRVQATAGQELGSALQRAMNSSFRGARWNTTLNEFGELSKNLADYGGIKLVKPSEWSYYKSKYGFGDNGDISKLLPADQRASFEANMKNAKTLNDQLAIFKVYSKFMDGVDKLTQWNAYVQDFKDATYLRTAEEYYSSQKYADDMNRMLAKQNKPQTAKPLEGAELINAVRKDFGERMLPMDRFYKMIKADRGITKPLLMYLDSSTRMTMQTGKAAVGLNTAGKNASRSVGTRIIANQADFVPRVAYALARGVPLAAVFNLPQMDDYSGIQEEDKTALDEIVRYSSALSPLLSLFSYGYNQYRQDEIAREKGQNVDENLKGDWVNRTKDNALKTITPLGGWLDQTAGLFGNLNNSIGVAQRGYGENKNGRVQYLAPDNPVDWIRGLIEGMSGTSNAREYNKNPDLLSAIMNEMKRNSEGNIIDYNEDGKADGGFGDFIKNNQALNSFPFDFGLKDENDYNRPQNQYKYADYNGEIKKALEDHDKDLAKEWYEKGRAYNAILDNLRVDNPEAVDVYYSSMGKNLVQPEKWKTVLYGSNPNGEPDLTVWNLMKDMAIKQSQDFGTPLDPAYTQLDDEQTRRYLQYKSTATGEDTALKKIMTQDPFWKEFFNAQSEYWKQIPNDFDDAGKTERVQEWNDWNSKYSDYMSFISGNINGIKDQELALQLSLQFPLMAEYQSLKTALQSKYGDNWNETQEYKNFWSQNYDAYQEESTAYNEQMLYIINQMRRIEGYDDMTLDELEAVNKIGYDSKKSNSGYSKKGSGSSGDGGYSYAPQFENTFQASPVYASVPKPSKMKYNPAGKANFAKVPMSGTMGGQPYAAV